MFHETDVFVAGGGPAGLAAAIAARRKGFRVALADSAQPSTDQAIDKACGEGLLPAGVAALSSLGIAIPAQEVFPFRGIRFLDSGISVDGEFPRGRGIGIRRTVLHRILIEHAASAGVTLLWGKRVTGISSDGVILDDHAVRCRWILGADGGASRIRCWAGLDPEWRVSRRFGFRRHYEIAPWTDYVELYWGDGRQIYVTPVGPRSVCVALITRDPHARLDEALPDFRDLAERLGGARAITLERGAVSATRRVATVHRGRIALAGDAAGSVDAITGEGLSLAFRHALALAEALEAEDLGRYQAEHARIGRRPAWMGRLLLTLDRRAIVRRPALRVLSSNPAIFERMLALHAGVAAG